MIREREVNMAAKMYESRRLVKALIGEEAFKENVEVFRARMQAIFDGGETSEMGAMIIFMREAGDNGHLSLLTMAACTEIMEPSNA